MPLLYQPKLKTVVICDFRNFVEPEMVKTRPVVVVARHKRNSKLVSVVPLSSTPPEQCEDYHHRLLVNPLAGYLQDGAWAKCDMLYTVSTDRLDRVKVARGNYTIGQVSDGDFAAIQHCMINALQLKAVMGRLADLLIPAVPPLGQDQSIESLRDAPELGFFLQPSK